MCVAFHVPEIEDHRSGDEAEGGGGHDEQCDAIPGNDWNGAGAEAAEVAKDHAPAQSDHEQDDEENEETLQQRFPDAERHGEQRQERPQRIAKSGP